MGPPDVEGRTRSLARRPGGRRAARRRLEHRAEVAGRQRPLQQPRREDLRPRRLNWVAASDYIDAAEKYVAGYCETGRWSRTASTGETQEASASTAWSPGRRATSPWPQKKGGLVSIVSTKEYSSQMPNVIIGIDKWMQDNRDDRRGHARGDLRGRRPGQDRATQALCAGGRGQRRWSTTRRTPTPTTGRSTSTCVRREGQAGPRRSSSAARR